MEESNNTHAPEQRISERDGGPFMRIAIDVNTLIDGGGAARPGALEVVRHLIEQGNDIVYYTGNDNSVSWIEQHFPRSDVVLYLNVTDKLVTLYEREHAHGSIALIDAAWQEVIAEFHRLALGEHATTHPNSQAVATWLSQYLILVACGPRVVVDSVLTVMLRLSDWQDAGEVLRAFSGSSD